MSTRCAVCGSKNVVKEFKKEGYDVKKGVIGTVLVGVPGALAGAGGKDVTYYHCADCGQVMNRPMYQVESDWIDKLLENPKQWSELLKKKKEEYKNIEWDESADITKTSASSSQDLEDMIVNALIQSNNLLDKKRLMKKCNISDEIDLEFDGAIRNLEDFGRVVCKSVDSEEYVELITDTNEILRLYSMRKAEIEASRILHPKKEDEYFQMFIDNMEKGKQYSDEEIKKCVEETFKDKIVSDNPYMMSAFMSRLMFLLRRRKVIVRNSNNTFSIQSVEKAKEDFTSLVENKKRELEEKTQQENQLRRQAILNYLTKTLEYASIIDLIEKSEQPSQCGSQHLTPILNEMLNEGLIEVMVEKKRNYYGIAGIKQKLEQKRIEEEQRREEQRRIKRENINKQIKAEEEKYNQELETLQKQLSEQEAIFEANKSKIFGAGAKAKKEAKQSIEYYSNQIEKLKQDYLNKKSSLQAELQKL